MLDLLDPDWFLFCLNNYQFWFTQSSLGKNVRVVVNDEAKLIMDTLIRKIVVLWNLYLS